MSEGPQVRLLTERLQKQLQGRTLNDARTTRKNLRAFSEILKGVTVERVFCKGKHIFMGFSAGLFLQNHLLMRGRWRTIKGRLLLLPTEMWLALETRHTTVANINGQILRPLDAQTLQQQLDSLGPDVMSGECSREQIMEALRHRETPIGDVLLDQSTLSGIGNIAKSEALFLARVHPEMVASQLCSTRAAKLAECIRFVMWESYKARGHWTHRVYRRAGMKCYECGNRIVMIRQGKQRRSTYFCRACQTY